MLLSGFSLWLRLDVWNGDGSISGKDIEEVVWRCGGRAGKGFRASASIDIYLIPWAGRFPHVSDTRSEEKV